MSASYYRHALPAGEILGDYEIVSVLGAGGFGVTYLVKHRTMGDRFALKEYFPQSLADREGAGTVVVRTHTFEEDYYRGLHGFLEEARIVRRLRGHPNVVHVNTFFEANNTAYMVMEYYAGQPLTAFRRQNGDQLDEATLRRIFNPVLDALEYVHQQGVVHRDLKPDNVFLCEDGRPILLDFGASRIAAAGSTVPMTAVLTPGYAPPEQYISEDSGETILRQGPWSDLYALGATLHMLACGRAPYDAMSRQMNAGQDPQPPAHTRLEGYSAAFCAAIDACLRLDQRQRPQSVAQFRALWNGQAVAAPPPLPQASAAATPQTPTRPVPATPARPVVANTAPALAPATTPARRSLWPVWTALAVVLAGAGGATWWVLQPDRPMASSAPSAPASTSTPVAASSVLMIYTDAVCQLRVNGADLGELMPGTPRRLDVQAGEQAVECVEAQWPELNNRHTKAVAAGQQAVVEFHLQDQHVEEPDTDTDVDMDIDGAADPQLAVSEMSIMDLVKPSFNDPVSQAPTTGPLGRARSAQPSASTHIEDWFGAHQLSLRTIAGPSSPMPVPSWNGGFQIPDFVPEQFDGVKLLKVIDSGEAILSLYGRDFSSATRLLAQHPQTGAGLYALDFSAYVQSPQRIDADRDFVNQQVVWAQQLDGVLYVAHGHNTYAKSSYGHTGYITALDIDDGFNARWHSPAQVSNAANFLIRGDHLISGYGFTAEPDYLYVFNRHTGAVLQRVQVKSGPDYILANDNALFVRTYDTDYEFPLP